MLETDEVDDDFFTPVASTSLANIFGKPAPNVVAENETLKYTPPKVQNVDQKTDDSKATSCVFACALVGYEWYNNVYTSKGKLGFAVIKVLKTGIHNIILYDSNKITLSYASVLPKLEITIKGNNYISYYDDQKRYWSLYGSEEDINKTVAFLKTFDIVIKFSNQPDVPPKPIKEEKQEQIELEESKDNVKSDTDSSVNIRNKAAILNRMANMGHSVLPQSHKTPIEKSSDSSDTNDSTLIKTVRHKTPKAVIKRSYSERSNEPQKNFDAPICSTEIQHIKPYFNDQLLPLPTTSIITTTNTSGGNEMNLFMTEQRIHNTELRMNIVRMSDKIDQVYNKINDAQKDHNTGNFSMEILQKLLREYENKISYYENMLKEGSNSSQLVIKSTSSHNEELEAFKNRISDLETVVKDKNDYVLALKNEIQSIKESNVCHDLQQNNAVTRKISDLEQELKMKNEKVAELMQKLENSNKIVNRDLENKIKIIMNDAYRAIVNNFENDESYSGESIKIIVGKVIKKVTMSAFDEI